MRSTPTLPALQVQQATELASGAEQGQDRLSCRYLFPVKQGLVYLEQQQPLQHMTTVLT